MKTPDERGPLGAWAYESRTERLDVSPEQVVSRLGKYDPATIRKAEADGRKNMSRPLWRALTKLYAEWAQEKGVILDAMPPFSDEQEAPATDSAAIVAAIDRLTAAVEAQAQQQREGLVALGGLLGEALSSLAASLERTRDELPDRSSAQGR